MGDNQYLTKKLKEYYLSDFGKLSIYKNVDFWSIDEDLLDILKIINKNSNIQTLYSKRYTLKGDAWNTEQNSYLEIAFTKKVHSQLLLLLTEIRDYLSNNYAQVTFMEISPRKNPNYELGESSPLGCQNNPNYFMINHIHIEMESSYLNNHNLFWECIESNFKLLILK